VIPESAAWSYNSEKCKGLMREMMVEYESVGVFITARGPSDPAGRAVVLECDARCKFRSCCHWFAS